jgi:hypothetical protein
LTTISNRSFYLVPEEVEPVLPPSNELHKLSLIDSTNTTNSHVQSIEQLPFSTTKISMNSSLTTCPSASIDHQYSTMNSMSMTNENLTRNLWPVSGASSIRRSIDEQIDNSSKSSIPPTSIIDAFDSNLSALVQSNNPTNPFSPYGYSMAAQAQSPNTNHRQPTIFTPKRGTNPFDDDLIRR